MFEFLKLLISKEFVTNAKDIIALLRKTKEWKKDIVIYSGRFLKSRSDEASVLIERSIAKLKEKNWSDKELKDVYFISKEIIRNAFEHGLPNLKTNEVFCKFTLTSSFIKLSVTDNGINFSLIDELKKQNAYSDSKDLHRGLSFLVRITPEIEQKIDGLTNTIIIIKRRGINPLTIKKIDNVTIFNIGQNLDENPQVLEKLVSNVKNLKQQDKVILNFGLGDRTDDKSRAIVFLKDTFTHTQNIKSGNIVIAGVENSSTAIQEYLEHYFPVFEDIDAALSHFRQATEY